MNLITKLNFRMPVVKRLVACLPVLISLIVADSSSAQFTADAIVSEAEDEVSRLTDKDGVSLLNTNARVVLRFKVMFATQGKIDGRSSDIATYNSFANTQARLTNSIFGGAADSSITDADQWDWKAVLSTNSGTRAEVNSSTQYDDDADYASDKITIDMINPVFNTHSGLLASNYRELWEEPLVNMNKTQTLANNSGNTWTGTDKLPVGNSIDKGLGGGANDLAFYGKKTPSVFWKNGENKLKKANRIYAISPLLYVVNVNFGTGLDASYVIMESPEPTTFAMFLIGILVCLCCRRGRKEAKVAASIVP